MLVIAFQRTGTKAGFQYLAEKVRKASQIRIHQVLASQEATPKPQVLGQDKIVVSEPRVQNRLEKEKHQVRYKQAGSMRIAMIDLGYL